MKILILTLALLQSMQDIYNAANADMDAGRWTDAASKFESVLKEDPSHVPSQFNLAICFSKIGKLDDAIALYRKILEQDANLYEAHINLGLMLDGAEAAEHFEKAVALRPDDPNAHLVAGLSYVRNGQLEIAYPHLALAEKGGISSADLFIALSEAEHIRKNEDKSVEYLEKASALDPTNRNVKRQLGIIYRDSGEFAKAITVLKPLLPDAKLELALSYFDNRNFAEAAGLFEELVLAQPGNVDLLYILGKSYMEQKQYPKALLMLTRVLQLDSNYSDAYSTMGSIYYLQEDWTRAAQSLLRFTELKPGQAFAHFVIASSFDKLGKTAEAILHYNRFLELDDGSNDVRSFQARQRARTLERRLKR